MDEYMKRKIALDDLYINEEIDYTEWEKKTIELKEDCKRDRLSKIEERLDKVEKDLKGLTDGFMIHLKNDIELSRARCESMFNRQQTNIWEKW